MRILVIFFLLFTFPLLAQKENQFRILKNTSSVFEFTHDFSSFSVDSVSYNAQWYARVSAEGYYPSVAIGEPQLPVFNKVIEVPLGSRVRIKIKEKIEEVYAFSMSYPIIPVFPPLSKKVEVDTATIRFSTSYTTNAFFTPLVGKDRVEGCVSVKELGQMRGKRLVELSVAPISYNPISQTLQVITHLAVELWFEDTVSSLSTPLPLSYISPEYQAINKQIEQENSSVNALIPTYNGRTLPSRYVIVSHPDFANELIPFISWKKRKGFDVVVAYTNQPEVGSTSTAIKSYLTQLYQMANDSVPPPSYILLVGDVYKVPTFAGKKGNHATDLPYGEYTNDYLPEVMYGRFSATTPAELKPQIDKTLAYEQYTFPNPAFLSQSLLIAGKDAEFQKTHANRQIRYIAQNYANQANGVTAHVFYAPESNDLVPIIKDKLNTGVGFVNYTAHGDENGWRGPKFMLADVAAMTNQGKYPFVISNACETNKFNLDVCFGEALLRAVNTGAVAHIGASNDSYWDEDLFWAVGFHSMADSLTYENSTLGVFDRLYHTHQELPTEQIATGGQIIQYGNMNVMQYGSLEANYYWEIYHIMGDPSLMPYLKMPDSISLSAPIIPLNASSIYIKTTPYTLVSLTKNDLIYAVAYADSQGVAHLSFSPFLKEDTLSLVITGQNKIPFMGELFVKDKVEHFSSFPLNSSYPWQEDAAHPWQILSLDSTDFTAVSGQINDNDYSELSISLYVYQEDTISFLRKVSSGVGDSLVFYIDNIPQLGWTGEKNWEKVSFYVSEGSHTFTWVYKKDSIDVAGEDRAMIDDISFPLYSVGTFVSESNQSIVKPSLDVLLMPNPTASYVTLSGEYPPSPVQLKIVDMVGKVMYSRVYSHEGGAYASTLDVSAVENGIYFVLLQVGETRIVKRLVKVE